MNTRTKSIALVSLVVTTIAACGSPEEVETKHPAPTDDAFVTASEQTRRELGIAKWGVTSDATKHLAVVHGYAANDEPLVELRHETKIVDDDHVDVEIALSGARGKGEMRIAFESRPASNPEETELEVTLRENTFGDANDSQRVLERMSADTGEGATVLSAAELANGGGSLVGEKLTPSNTGELVRRCAALAASCGYQVVRTGATTVWNTQTCRSALISRGITLLCRWAGGQVGRRVGAAAGAVGGPIGIAVGAGVGKEVGSELAEQGCRYVVGNSEAEEQRNTRECVAATAAAATETARGSTECQTARADCTGR